ncbi:MAG: alpha/beta hydrolase fold domain-containing protein, partial [Adlercreutzia sp.]
MPNKIDVLARISPQMAAVLAKEDELAGDANDTSAGFAQMRENYVAGRAWWNEGAPEMDRVVDDAVEGSFGAIGVRRYYPCEIAEGATAPAIVYVHGGGFVLGNLDTHDRICRILAKRAGVP